MYRYVYNPQYTFALKSAINVYHTNREHQSIDITT